MVTLTKLERETIVRFSEDPEDSMTFETFNKRHALRLIRDGAEVKHTATRGGMTYWTLSMPRKWFRWPRKPSAAVAEAARNRILAQGGRILPRRSEETPTPVAEAMIAPEKAEDS